MRMFCVKCGKMMRVKKTGVTVRYGRYEGYFRADLWECPECGCGVVTGLGEEILDFGKEVDYEFE